MQSYSIGKVCKFLKVKPHVLRYWEQEISLLSPRKTESGRRIYTDHEIQVLFRLKYLLYERRFTIEGARRQIWQEFNTADLNLKSKIAAIRSDLLVVLSDVRHQAAVLDEKVKKP